MRPDELAVHVVDSVVEPLEWGARTYTIMRLPEEVADAVRAAGAKRVRGTADGAPLELALTRAPVVEGTFLWAGKGLLRQIGARAGDPVTLRIHAVADDDVPVPADVMEALDAAAVVELWEELTPGRRRSLLYPVSTARSSATRERRVAALVDAVVTHG